MTDKPVSRTLVVLLHADVAGSTALVQQDEALAHTRLTDAFHRFASTIKDYGGSVHEVRGDALVAEFARVSDAVAAALVFQQTNLAHNAKFNDAITPVLRMGVSLSEVIIADDTVTGPGVVLAQRLEQLAEPGGVCIQQAVYEALPRHLPFDYDALGEQQLKGFDESVRAYAVKLRGGAEVPTPESRTVTKEPRSQRKGILATVTATALILIGVLTWWQPWKSGFEPASEARMAFPLPDKPSIAVLPFGNMSDDPRQEYFVDGMTEDLITDLSKLSGLFVIARNSVFTYKGKPVKVRQVAEELGVRYVLEGSVRRAGNEVRINAQLIDATTGGHVWADRYDGSLDNVFAMQDKVTQKIVAALAVKLTAREAEEVARKGTSNVAAYDAFLQGWAHYVQDTPDQFAKAIPYFNKAVELDPDYGRAYAALASVYYLARVRRWFRQLGLNHTESFRLAFENQEKAMHKPTSFAHAVASLIHLYQRRHDEAITEAERAIALDPNDPNGYVRMGHALTMAGRPEEAVALVEKAMRLDPHYPPTYLWVLGLTYFGMERFDRAVTMLEKAFKGSPALAGLTLAATYGHLDRKQEAEVVLQIEKKLIPPGFPYTARRAIRHYPFKDSADAERFADGLRKAGLE